MKNIITFKNVYGEQRRGKFLNFELGDPTTDGRLLAVNNQFLASSWNTQGGAIAIFNPYEFTSVSMSIPLIKGHKAPVLDLKFSPFRSDLLASSSEDGTVKLWQIPEEGIKRNISREALAYTKHSKKVALVTFNPVASDVIASASIDLGVHVWNAMTGQQFSKIEVPDSPTSLEWNVNGSLLGINCKNRTLAIYDPRANKFIANQEVQFSSKSGKCGWINNEEIVTVGFGKRNARELKHWDLRKIKDDLTFEDAVSTTVIDRSSSIAAPFIDRESKIVYVLGKGEGNISTFDYNNGSFAKGLGFQSGEGGTTYTMLDRRYCDYNKCEIDRFAKYNAKNKTLCYISFYVPRRNPTYERSIYPPVECGEPAMTYEEWTKGETKEPLRKDINQIENKFIAGEAIQAKPEEEEPRRKYSSKVESSGASSSRLAPSRTSGNSELETRVTKLEEKVEELVKEVERLKKELEDAKKGNKSSKIVIPEVDEKNESESNITDKYKFRRTRTQSGIK